MPFVIKIFIWYKTRGAPMAQNIGEYASKNGI
jgi:hypothetical protein